MPSPIRSRLQRLMQPGQLVLAVALPFWLASACTSGPAPVSTDGGAVADTSPSGSDSASADTTDAAGDSSIASTDSQAVAADTQADTGVAPKLYGVGVIDIETPGPGGRSLPTSVWYPIAAGTKGEVVKYMGLIASPNGAVANALPEKGPFPLVAFSHGNQGVRQQSAFLVEALAMHGYVVVAPDHVGNTFLDYDDKLLPAITALRPLDLRAAIDRMFKPSQADPPWLAGLADAAHIGVAGHSFGGYTALAVAGALVNVPPEVIPDCAQMLPGDPTCAAMKLAGKLPWDFHDARVKVALPLAHCGQFKTFGFDLPSMKQVAMPVILQAATGDDTCLLETQAKPAYASLGGPHALITMQGGNHFSYSDLCAIPPNLSPQIAAYCTNLKPDLETAHVAILKYALAAFDLYLRGDESARPTFQPRVDGVVEVKSVGIAP